MSWGEAIYAAKQTAAACGLPVDMVRHLIVTDMGPTRIEPFRWAAEPDHTFPVGWDERDALI